MKAKTPKRLSKTGLTLIPSSWWDGTPHIFRLRTSESLFNALFKEAETKRVSINFLINQKLEKATQRPKK